MNQSTCHVVFIIHCIDCVLAEPLCHGARCNLELLLQGEDQDNVGREVPRRTIPPASHINRQGKLVLHRISKILGHSH
jgi:hypothetical protein